ncbi:MAG: hypothetical protein JW969_16305 [Spirochaetales bacterium]|nr:hypothetical protein [Spirochaetales bacterium]
MLEEIRNVRQFPDDPVRRWFSDDYFDLIVWFDGKDRIIGFQLCYDKVKNEHSLTWYSDSGFVHNRIDDGEHPGHLKMSPILVPDGVFENEKVAGLFKERSGKLDSKISGFVYKKILKYPAS